MSLLFDEDGIRFRYPETWELEREDNETGWTVSVRPAPQAGQKPDTAFMVLSLMSDDENVLETQDVARTALEALREEYSDLESEECVDSVAGQPAFGHVIRFFSMDLTNTCWTRSFQSPRGTLLLMWQANDLELPRHEGVLRAICASVQVEED